MVKKRKKYLLIYDISDIKRRNKVIKILNGIGYRVQKSAFEIELSYGSINEFVKKVKSVVNKKEDSVRIYSITEYTEVINLGNYKEYKIENNIIL